MSNNESFIVYRVFDILMVGIGIDTAIISPQVDERIKVE